jgi:hypothetical protein
MIKLLLSFVLLCPVYAFSQFLATGATLEEAKKVATDKSKPIAVLVEASSCSECNTVAEKSLQNASLHSLLATDFVVLQISPEHEDRQYIQRTYNYREGNIVLFLDAEGTLIHRMNKSTTRYEEYIDECKKALQQQSGGADMRMLEMAGLEGKLNDEELLTLIKKRKTVGLTTDKLLELYTTRIPVDSLYTISMLQEIVRLTPILQSAADKALRKDMDLFKQAWYRLPLQERVLINQQIIQKSLGRAIQQKNPGLAYRTATFAREINDNPIAGAKAYDYNMLQYFHFTGDTRTYLKQALAYYDRYYMSMSQDSIRRQDSLLLEKSLKNTPVTDTVIRTRTSMTVRKTVAVRGLAQSVCLDLNRAARDLYSMTKDTTYLRKALNWAAYANSLYPNSEALDIHARLLYQLDNNTAKAIELEEQAIALRQKRGLDSKEYTTTLENMRKGKL